MNRKQLITLVVLLVIAAVAGVLLRQRQNSSWQSTSSLVGKKLLGDFPVNDVAHIAITQTTNSLNLVKKTNTWRVAERNDYPANYSQISDFLLKAQELKITQVERVGPSQMPRFALEQNGTTNSPVTVDFKDSADKSLKRVLLGKKHMRKGAGGGSPFGEMGEEGFPDGRFVKVDGDSGFVDVIADSLANIEPKPAEWLNKDFFKIEKPRTISVTYPVATNSWRVSRGTETEPWKLEDAKPTEQLDTGKTSGLANALNNPTFVDVAAGSSAARFGLEKPTTLAIETFDHLVYTLKVGQKTNDDIPLMMTVEAKFPKERIPGKDEKPEDKQKLDKEFQDAQKKLQEKVAQEKGYENWVYLVSNWTLDPILKERAQLLVEKKEEPKKEEKPVASDGNKESKPATGTSPAPAPAGAPNDATPKSR